MAFYLIGLGLDKGSIQADALKILKNCDEVYLESYTVNFPYEISELESLLGVKLKILKRSAVEDESVLDGAPEKDVALLVYGDCLLATTHIQLILECERKGISYKIFNNSSIMTAVARTGLQLYKFGKTASMPDWRKHTNKPTSFMDYVRDNLSIEAHTLLLTDIGLDFPLALEQLKEVCEKESLDVGKLVVISMAGTDSQKIYYGSLEDLAEKKVKIPFCIVIPSKLHFVEEEALGELAVD